MKEIGEHENVISILGYCTYKGPLYMVMELAERGNLRDYLRLHDSNKELQHYSFIENDTDTSNQGIYDTVLTQKDLVGFAIQIASGLTFLESKKVNFPNQFWVLYHSRILYFIVCSQRLGCKKYISNERKQFKDCWFWPSKETYFLEPLLP